MQMRPKQRGHLAMPHGGHDHHDQIGVLQGLGGIRRDHRNPGEPAHFAGDLDASQVANGLDASRTTVEEIDPAADKR